jgi:hypothetical protein
MAYYVTKDARPQLTSGARIYKEQIDEDGLYWGIPQEYFEIEGRNVYMSSDIAHLFEWNLDAVCQNYVNINTYAQWVDIDGETYGINPGSFCSNVKKENFIDENI